MSSSSTSTPPPPSQQQLDDDDNNIDSNPHQTPPIHDYFHQNDLNHEDNHGDHDDLPVASLSDAASSTGTAPDAAKTQESSTEAQNSNMSDAKTSSSQEIDVASNEMQSGDKSTQLEQQQNDSSSAAEKVVAKNPPPPIPHHLRLQQMREKQSQTTRSNLKAIAGCSSFGFLYPPVLISSGVATAHTIMQELRFRQKLDREKGLAQDRPVSTHLSEMLADAKDAILGRTTEDDTLTFSLQELESSIVPSNQTDHQALLEKHKLPAPQSDFTKACFEGNRQYLQKHWNRLKEQGLTEFDFTPHDYQYALHYAAVSGRAEVCKQLINWGCDNTTQWNGKTAEQMTSNLIVQDTIRAFSLLRRELDILIGLEKIKRNIYQMTNKIILDKRRAMIAQKNGSKLVRSVPRRHMVICGNPGTGKTKVASLISHLYYALGLIKKDIFVTAQRGDLCAQFVGQTAPRTRKMIEKAAGGVLFVDEAYRLSQNDNPGRDYGQEAIDEIMQHMTDESSTRTIFIFAGYEKPMQRFIQSNPGIFRRVDYRLHFEDYSCLDLARITMLNVKLSGYKLSADVDENEVAALIDKHTEQSLRSQMNGGLSEKLVQFAIQVQNEMLSLDATEEELEIISKQHIEIAIKLVVCGGDIHELESELLEEAEEAYNNMNDEEKKQIEEVAAKMNDMMKAETGPEDAPIEKPQTPDLLEEDFLD